MINFAEIINKIISTFRQISKRTTDSGQFKGFRSIGRNNEYVNLKSIVGCSSEVEYNKRKVGCLKRFMQLVKHQVKDFLGSDLIFPMLLLLDLPISKINAQDQSYLKVLMQIDENTNLIEYLRDKLVNPSEAYLREKILIDSKHDTIVNQDINLQEVISTTNTPETAFDLQSDSPNVGSNQPIETAESRNEVASLKLVDINLAREISENEINIASMKDSIALINQNKDELEKLVEILSNFMNMNFTSADIRKNVVKKDIFRVGNERLIQKITHLSQSETLNQIVPIPICTHDGCSYTIKPGFTRTPNKLLPSNKCKNENNNIFCDVSIEENICKTRCKIIKTLPHTQEILLYNDKLFLYPFDYTELLGHSFENNVSYFIQSEFNTSFTFKNREYILLANELVDGLSIDKIGEFISRNWEHYLHTYKNYILITISSLSTFIGIISSIYFCKKKLESSNSTRSVRINMTRVVFNRTPTN